MTRLDRLLLRIPRLRQIVLDRDTYSAHAARLQRQLDENLVREEALRHELADVEREAAARERAIIRERDAAAAHATRLQRELDEALGAQRVLTQPPIDPAPQSVTDRMRADWDTRARTEGTYFIATSREPWTDESFFASGEETVGQYILSDMTNICGGRDPQKMRVLEIGCGAGRITKALARTFGEVHAVDISPEMIRLARENLAEAANVHLYVNSGADLQVLPDVPFHFAFSFIVFQHIPDKAIIENYLREVHRALAPGALFKVQVEGGDTSDRDASDTWHGASFTNPEMRAIAERTGFDLRYTEGAGTQYFWLWLFKPVNCPIGHKA
jgi:SAM-dependent methyltransferase